MKLHWKVMLWMLAGVLGGFALQQATESVAWDGATWSEVDGPGIRLTKAVEGGPVAGSKLAVGDLAIGAVRNRGRAGERSYAIEEVADWTRALAESGNGDVLFVALEGGRERLLTLGLDPSSPRARWLYPFHFIADIFLALLTMLIVPLVLTSIVSGVASVGSMGGLRRLGGKTFGYYVATSLLAILVGQLLVTLIRPGVGAELGLARLTGDEVAPDEDPLGILRRMIPSNVFRSLAEGDMLQVIFFALLLGYFVTRAASPHKERISGLFESLFEVAMKLAEGVLSLLPYGVFALMVRVVAKTGFAVFEPLLLYMAVVVLALVLHACVTLPLILRFVGKLNPRRWAQAMSPALMTAFSTSSSSMTLPVTLETVERRGKVSNRVTSFTLPLGATINMDGTALYECIGVVFLAQYYGGVSGFELSLAQQGLIVLLALLASIGAAGIPSAGLVMMLTILHALHLPLEGAALLLAVDRPLDMLRTVVNVWSDTCGAAVIARSEGETGPLEAGAPG